MELVRQLASVWDTAGQPVLALAPAGAGYAPCYSNPAVAAALGDDPFAALPAAVAAPLCAPETELQAAGAPLFCPVGERVFALTPFAWQGARVCLLQDVTAYYNENQRVLNEAVMANRAKTSFLSEMSHDIRTPMGAIIGMTDIALMQPDIPTRVRECLDKIKTASGHMMSLLNEVLDMSLIESGRVVLQPGEVDIADILHELLTVARPQADARRLQFRLTLGQLAEERLRVDGVRLKQICLNLLSNAIKFTPAGGTVELALSIEPGAEPGQVTLHLRVQDTGIGIGQDFIDRVFTPFEREQKSTVSKIQGTGLGMAITKSLVDMMGGTIAVHSVHGQGTTFTVELPLTAAPDPAEDQRRALHGQRVLLLDSADRRAAATLQMLQDLGMAADRANGVAQAAELMNEMAFGDGSYFALLTADRVDDAELLLFLPEVRQRMGAAFPILLLSENDWSQLEYVYTRAGVDAFIPLPLFRSRLCAGLYAFTEAGRAAAHTAAGGVGWDFRGRRVLLAEDNEINREIALELLGMAGLTVETAENGRLAVERFAAMPPHYYDLILMDIQMPEMNGLDAARAIRALPRPDAAVIPILAMTANAFVEDVKNTLEAGMNAHIAKPLDTQQLYATIGMFLKGAGQ